MHRMDIRGETNYATRSELCNLPRSRQRFIVCLRCETRMQIHLYSCTWDRCLAALIMSHRSDFLQEKSDNRAIFGIIYFKCLGSDKTSYVQLKSYRSTMISPTGLDSKL